METEIAEICAGNRWNEVYTVSYIKLYANLSAFNTALVTLKTFGSLKYNNIFQEIKREAMMQLKMSTADANKPENSFLNRYRDVKPYDHSRVKLETHHDTDYINASLVKVKTACHLPFTIKFLGNIGTFEFYIYTYEY